ncbi:MAG TPA: carboxypeptidase-like regulatory domain-containing protein [Terracidiphilus sp.]|nr:carboxypeptidase-like regulatory domain-containing protein [Terracidiphilus sp.]
MRRRAPRMVHAVIVLVFVLKFPIILPSQTATLSGTATDAKGNAIANAAVSLMPETGPAIEVHTDSNGNYSIPDLAPGDYTISASAEGLTSRQIKVAVTTSPRQTLHLLLTPLQAEPARPPNAPAAPSLEDLGFPAQQTQGDAQLQAMLEKRTRMLKTHQRLGIITTIPMAAAVITGPMAKAKGKEGEVINEPTQTNLDVHAALGGATTALYFTTAGFAIFAPRVPGTTKHGGIRWHEALAFVHGPGMVLTPILGVMAYNQENSGEKAHGIAAQHGTVAWITTAAYGASIVAISWPIHWKFWEK